MQTTLPGRATGGPIRSPPASSAGRPPCWTAARARSRPPPPRKAPSRSPVSDDRSTSDPSSSSDAGRSRPGGPTRSSFIASPLSPNPPANIGSLRRHCPAATGCRKYPVVLGGFAAEDEHETGWWRAHAAPILEPSEAERKGAGHDRAGCDRHTAVVPALPAHGRRRGQLPLVRAAAAGECRGRTAAGGGAPPPPGRRGAASAGRGGRLAAGRAAAPAAGAGSRARRGGGAVAARVAPRGGARGAAVAGIGAGGTGGADL